MLKLVVLSISSLLLSTIAINGILPEIRDALEITQTQSEMLITISSISKLIFVVLSNPLIKRFGMKKVVLFGLIIAGIGGLFPVFYNVNYPFIMSGRFLLGAGNGLIFTSSITYINVLFDEKERVSLLGYRSAVEMFGQTLVTLIIGFLSFYSWNISFLVHFLYFIIAIGVYFIIPEIKEKTDEQTVVNKDRMPIVIYGVAIFIGFLILSNAMITIRFPAILTEAIGGHFNSSFIVALKPILGIIAAILFGKIHKIIGSKLFYIGVICLISSQLLIGFSNHNVPFLIIGFLLSSFVMGWVLPVIIESLSKITSGQQQRVAMSYVLVCGNIGVFLMPYVVRWFESISKNPRLTTPYIFMAFIITTILTSIAFLMNIKSFRKKVGLSYDKNNI